MALIKCKKCRNEVPDDASFCPYCGSPMGNFVESVPEEYDDSTQKKKTWIWILVVVALFLIGGICFYIFDKNINISEVSNENDKDSLDVVVEEEPKEAVVELTPGFIEAIKKYNKFGVFSDGLAVVRKGDRWGYINTKGEEVIPTKINALLVGNFSDGLAFVSPDVNGGADFYVIDKEGKTVFKGKHFYLDANGYGMDSDDMPYFIEGKLYVITHNGDEFKYDIYDKQGNKTGSVDYEIGNNFYKNHQTGEYTLFSKSHDDRYDESDSNNKDQTYGLKNLSGKVIIPPDYDEINGQRDGTVKISNGVVLVAITEYDENYDGGEDGNTKYHWGYADLKGNDTFTTEEKNRWYQSKKSAKQNTSNEKPEWLQGRWIGSTASGNSVEVIIEGDVFTEKIEGQVTYSGSYDFNGDMLIYDNASAFWPVDKDSKALTLDGRPMRKAGAGASTSSSRGYYSDEEGSSHSSYRFSSAHDVIGYLSGRTFYNGSRRLRIRPDGVWLNDYCATGAPSVERFESWKALVRAFTATGQRLSFLIDPIHGQITDEAGDVFSLR